MGHSAVPDRLSPGGKREIMTPAPPPSREREGRFRHWPVLGARMPSTAAAVRGNPAARVVPSPREGAAALPLEDR